MRRLFESEVVEIGDQTVEILSLIHISPLAARTHAVIACYAAGGVYFVFLEVQALGLA